MFVAARQAILALRAFFICRIESLSVEITFHMLAGSVFLWASHVWHWPHVHTFLSFISSCMCSSWSLSAPSLMTASSLHLIWFFDFCFSCISSSSILSCFSLFLSLVYFLPTLSFFFSASLHSTRGRTRLHYSSLCSEGAALLAVVWAWSRSVQAAMIMCQCNTHSSPVCVCICGEFFTGLS